MIKSPVLVRSSFLFWKIPEKPSCFYITNRKSFHFNDVSKYFFSFTILLPDIHHKTDLLLFSCILNQSGTSFSQKIHQLLLDKTFLILKYWFVVTVALLCLSVYLLDLKVVIINCDFRFLGWISSCLVIQLMVSKEKADLFVNCHSFNSFLIASRIRI